LRLQIEWMPAQDSDGAILEAQLDELAIKTGRGTEELVQKAVARMLEYGTRFSEAVEERRASARRGDCWNTMRWSNA